MLRLSQLSPPAMPSAPEPSASKHSVLYVGFDHGPACPLENAQTACPDTALRQLSEGCSWAALLHCEGHASPALDWMMRVRHHPSSMRAVLLALVDDAQGPVALQALRAGADVVLPAAVPTPLLQAQLANLRHRVAPPPGGSLNLGAGRTLLAATRELRHAGRSTRLQPQMFRLLWALCERPGHVLSSASLRVALDIPARADAQALHTAVGKLRRVLREHGLEPCLKTVHGSGYRWAADAADASGFETTTRFR